MMLRKTTMLSLLLFSFLLLSGSNFAQDKQYSQGLLDRFKAMTTATLAKSSATPNRAQNNMTLLRLEAKKNWNKLTPEAQSFFSAKATRPTGLGSVYEEKTVNFFRFYYTTSGTEAVATADANSNGVPDYVENMAAVFVKALSFYDSCGYNRPPVAASDNGRFCVYLSNSEAGDYVYGYSQPETTIGDNPLTTLKENSSTTSFMVMRNNYTGFGSTAAELQIAMEVTAAHEFFHCVQFGYEVNNMESFVMEMCSTWAEDKVFPGDDDNWQYLTDIFGTPDVSIDWDEALDGDAVNYSSAYAMHWYAAWIFMRYLTDQYGLDVPRLVYEATVSNDTPTSIDNVLKAKGTSFTAAIKDYNIALELLTASSQAPMKAYSFTRGNDYRTLTKNSGGSPAGPFVVKYDGTINFTGTKAAFSSTTNGNKRLMRASADFIKITPSKNFIVTATPKTANANFYVRLLKLDSYTNPTVLSVVEPTLNGSTYSITVNDKANYANYVLVVYNAKYATKSSRDTTSIQYDIAVDNSNSLALTSPKGGEQWLINSTHNITWTSSNVTNVKIEYSGDNGSTWSTVIASTAAAAGSYAWTVPATAAAQALVKVSDVDGNAAAVTSNVFSVVTVIVPKITLTSPVGGESWSAGSTRNITWTSNAVTSAMIELTTDGGSTWATIVASTPADSGKYAWTVVNAPSTNCKIRVSDASNATLNAVSAAAFTITKASQTILTEDFAKFTTGSIGSPSSTDVSASLDTYTATAGWTGSKVYSAGGAVKLGSSSGQGYLVTPVLDFTTTGGAGTIKFDVQTYGTDAKAIQVLLSTDGGTTFTQVGSDIATTATLTTQSVSFLNGTATTKLKIMAKAASSNRFYLDNLSVATGSAPTSVQTSGSTLASKGYELAQNYPNPFNPTTTIGFSLPEQATIQLKIFNQIGEEVATLVNGEMAAGAHSVVWNAVNMPSGIYFYVLKTSNSTIARKLVLMK